MKIIKYFALIVTISLATNLHAQKFSHYENNLNSYKEYFKDTLGITIAFPKEFNNLDVYSVGFKVSKNPKKPTGSAYGTFFLSKDKNCMIAFPLLLFGFTSEIPKENKTTAINTFSFEPKNQVINEIKIPLELYYHPFWSDNDKNKEVTFDVYKYADFIFGRKAREKYNADAYSISDIPKTDEFEFFSLRGQSIENLPVNKFSYCTSLFIQKGEKALDIKFFFTEKGFKKKEKYIKMLDKHIWFDENFKPD
ncbi:hypothetical protein [Siansivirga zeaxanthinifaciens]|uniref:Uncharacterized protein n=1 Tax=Siansivirga zeaxanthinifaciens CC-SAMT-1 TaxID=1454006 RepID=A0A0C5W0L5_9FLAO|nr:hypothetical protein [Siansivirga zeaxanthinifaciens]AJR04841.1 hypothetical protein AW14_06840 [Siansivirga zeaxanthinifaciens CC-SAMT-1]